MRLLIEGDEAAQVVNGWIQKAGYVPTSSRYDYKVSLRVSKYPMVTVDGIDCDLERRIVTQMELNGVPEFRLKRKGGVRSDKEVAISYPIELQQQVERGVYQGLMVEVGNYAHKQKTKKPKVVAGVMVALISLFMAVSMAHSQPIIYPPGVNVRDEGALQCRSQTLDFTGAGVVASCSGGIGTITIGGGVGGGAPDDALYWVGAAHAGLSAEKDLSGFTGLVLNTAGVPTSKAVNTCVNQFPRSDNASGVWTCATIADADVPNTITIDAAAALTADPADCATATHFAVGVNASGTATCEAIADADVPDTISLTNLTQIATRAISDTTGTLATTRGGTELTAAADDNVMVGNGTVWQTKAIPDCNLDTQTLAYDTATNAFSCGDDDSGGVGGGGNFGEATVTLGDGLVYQTTVTGQAWVTSTSIIVATVVPNTASNTVEATIAAGLSLIIANRVVGDGFDIYVHNPHGLTGDIDVHFTGS